tara:strand:- start:149 stop:802 length:654 start_codon:yes stop_codon:yes gene_type:complete
MISDVYVKRLLNQEYKKWILNKHYAKRGCSVSYAFGLIKNSKILGVCTFGHPPNYNYNNGRCLFDNFEVKTLELNRLVTNDLPKNYLSFFIGQCFKLLPKPMALVSYADPNVNHTGYIYQATNWIYTGVSTPKKRYHFEDGTSFDIRRGIHTKGKIVKIEDMKPTFRYIYLLGNKKEKKNMKKNLKVSSYPYPKMHNIYYKTKDLDMSYQEDLFKYA